MTELPSVNTHTHTHTHTHIYISLHMYEMGYYSVIKKEWNDGICDNMDESGGYYAKWYVRQRQIQVYFFTYMWNLKIKPI